MHFEQSVSMRGQRAVTPSFTVAAYIVFMDTPFGFCKIIDNFIFVVWS